jgi:hypothetical protein
MFFEFESTKASVSPWRFRSKVAVDTARTRREHKSSETRSWLSEVLATRRLVFHAEVISPGNLHAY